MQYLPDAGGDPETFNISIKVTDGATPIKGATVTIDGTSKTTGTAGGCSFNNISEGNIPVNVSAEGYITETFTLVVDKDHTSFDIMLEEE